MQIHPYTHGQSSSCVLVSVLPKNCYRFFDNAAHVVSCISGVPQPICACDCAFDDHISYGSQSRTPSPPQSDRQDTVTNESIFAALQFSRRLSRTSRLLRRTIFQFMLRRSRAFRWRCCCVSQQQWPMEHVCHATSSRRSGFHPGPPVGHVRGTI